MSAKEPHPEDSNIGHSPRFPPGWYIAPFLLLGISGLTWLIILILRAIL